MNKALTALLAILPLAACMAPQSYDQPFDPSYNQPVPMADPVAAAPGVTPVAGISGLQSREPDACHAGDYRHAIGQPGSVIPTLGITRSYNVVEYRGIESQEYDPLRIIFRLDQAGNITNIDCG